MMNLQHGTDRSLKKCLFSVLSSALLLINIFFPTR
uniref:Uncharacterized protein n=1 Tax=Arundo donax TaxID=35708 RepID=A0A0A9H203_ARUDO